MTETWPVEDLPDRDNLYLRVHRRWFGTDDALDLGCFRNQPDERTGGMSTDWSRYATPEQTRTRARSPIDNAVVALTVGDVRTIPGQRVEHSPTIDNRAHTDVWGAKSHDPEVRRRYSRIARMVLSLPSPADGWRSSGVG